MAKVFEGIVLNWVDDAITPQIDERQFGGLAGTGTTDALEERLHTWCEATDKPDTFVRVLLVDYSKAFDHINHEILIAKLYDMGLPAYLVRRMAALLVDRQQSVKIGDTVSSIGYPNGGVPQGTLSGPTITFWFKLMTYKHHAPCLNMLTAALYLTFVITVVCLCYKSLPTL